ncbi:MAG: ATP-grasp domain-containing protein [Methanobacteriota archaeon]|nr:MAG: ATP-grasp domain-containing protein [Euryarchaeota archaeon]
MSSEALGRVSVLVTAVGAPGAAGIISALRRNGERETSVFGVDMNSQASGKALVDGFSKVPKGNDPGFIDDIIDASHEFDVGVILPLSTEELLAFASAKDRIRESTGAVTVVSAKDAIAASNEKGKLFTRLASAGVPVPEHSVVRSPAQLRRACAELGHPGLPVCMKPSFAHGGRGFRVIEDSAPTDDTLLRRKPESASISLVEAERLLAGLESPPEMLVMEFLPGREYSVDLLCSKGEMLVAIPRSRDEIRSGISFRGTVVDRDDAVDVCRRVCDTMEFDGPIGVQFREDRDGALKVLEINPRLHGSVALSVAAGVNVPYLAVKGALNEPFDIPPIRYGTTMTRYWGATFHDKDGLPHTL